MTVENMLAHHSAYPSYAFNAGGYQAPHHANAQHMMQGARSTFAIHELLGLSQAVSPDQTGHEYHSGNPMATHHYPNSTHQSQQASAAQQQHIVSSTNTGMIYSAKKLLFFVLHFYELRLRYLSSIVTWTILCMLKIIKIIKQVNTKR